MVHESIGNIRVCTSQRKLGACVRQHSARVVDSLLSAARVQIPHGAVKITGRPTFDDTGTALKLELGEISPHNFAASPMFYHYQKGI